MLGNTLHDVFESIHETTKNISQIRGLQSEKMIKKGEYIITKNMWLRGLGGGMRERAITRHGLTDL